MREPNEVTVDIGSVSLIDLASQPLLSLDGKLRQQFRANATRSFCQRSLRIPVKITLQPKIDRDAKEQKRAGKESRVPGTETEP